MEHEMSTAAKEKVLGKYKLLSPDFKPPPPSPPFGRPSRLVKSLAGVDGGAFLIPRRRNDAGWRFIFPSLHSASGNYCLAPEVKFVNAVIAGVSVKFLPAV